MMGSSAAASAGLALRNKLFSEGFDGEDVPESKREVLG